MVPPVSGVRCALSPLEWAPGRAWKAVCAWCHPKLSARNSSPRAGARSRRPEECRQEWHEVLQVALLSMDQLHGSQEVMPIFPSCLSCCCRLWEGLEEDMVHNK